MSRLWRPHEAREQTHISEHRLDCGRYDASRKERVGNQCGANSDTVIQNGALRIDLVNGSGDACGKCGTRRRIQNPTAADTRIVVTFSLNEVGTAYCRATRSDSGTTSQDMHIDRVLAAQWSGAALALPTPRHHPTPCTSHDDPMHRRRQRVVCRFEVQLGVQ